jgi:hypothetical protein
MDTNNPQIIDIAPDPILLQKWNDLIQQASQLGLVPAVGGGVDTTNIIHIDDDGAGTKTQVATAAFELV